MKDSKLAQGNLRDKGNRVKKSNFRVNRLAKFSSYILYFFMILSYRFQFSDKILYFH